MGSKRFRIAFSFAGEKRAHVEQVADLLAARFGEAAILYDKYHEAEFARRNLGIYLPDLYHQQADLIVVVLCPDYDVKQWTGLEWTAIHALLSMRRDEEVMFCRFEHVMVEGLYDTTGFVELDRKTPDQLATLILERLALNEGHAKDHYTTKIGAGSTPTTGLSNGESSTGDETMEATANANKETGPGGLLRTNGGKRQRHARSIAIVVSATVMIAMSAIAFYVYNENSCQTIMNRAAAAEKKKDYRLALDLLHTANKKCPDDPEILFRLGNLQLNHAELSGKDQEYQAAIDAYEKVLNLPASQGYQDRSNTGVRTSVLNRTDAAEERKDYRAAFDVLRTALEKRPDDQSFLMRLGRLLVEHADSGRIDEDYKEAIADYEKVLKLPGDQEFKDRAIYDLGVVHMRLWHQHAAEENYAENAEFRKARDYAEQAVSDKHRSVDATYNLACLWALRSRSDSRFKQKACNYLQIVVDKMAGPPINGNNTTRKDIFTSFFGYKDEKKDPDLSAIRNESRFQILANRVAKWRPE